MNNETHLLSRSLVEVIAGFTAGIASTLVAHPLDIIKTRLQLEHGSVRLGNSFSIVRRIAANDGSVKAFYRGLTPNLIGNSASWALYFVWYDQIKRQVSSHHVEGSGLMYYEYFAASAAAGLLTALCTNPIWVIKTRMLSTSSKHPGAYQSMTDGVRQIYRHEGLRGFYRGLAPSLFGVSHGALQFMAYDSLKKYRKRGLAASDLSTVDYLLLSGFAKVFAGCATYPYQLIRTRLQMYDADALYRGSRDAVEQIWRKEGYAGFYKGLGPNLLRVMPSTMVTFVVYEKSRVYLQSLDS